MDAAFRQRSAALRREAILWAAIEVFARRGFHRSTIRDVARAAGVSDGSIYNVFENKNALLLGILDPLGEAEHDPRAAAIPAPECSNLRAFIHGLVSRRWATSTPKTLPMLRIVLSEVLIEPTLRAMFLDRVINPALTLPEPAFEALAADGRLGGGENDATPDQREFSWLADAAPSGRRDVDGERRRRA